MAAKERIEAGTNTVSYYKIYRSTVSGEPYTLIASVDPSGRPYRHNEDYIDDDVSNGSSYYYVVTAVCPEGESGYSAEGSATPSSAAHVVNSALATTVPNLFR
ncbi:MAG: hypothetical protein ACE5OR_10120 [bacterium]